MRIGLYGLPTAGKSYILSAVRNLEVLSGSSLLKEIAPNFHDLTESQKEEVRQDLALQLLKKDRFIMDGHYSFGDKVVFTEADGQLYVERCTIFGGSFKIYPTSIIISIYLHQRSFDISKAL